MKNYEHITDAGQLPDDLIVILGHMTNRDEAGRHYTEIYDDDVINLLTRLGLIKIEKQWHQCGLPYGPEYNLLVVTDEGRDLVDVFQDLFPAPPPEEDDFGQLMMEKTNQ